MRPVTTAHIHSERPIDLSFRRTSASAVIPLVRPDPPRLSQHGPELAEIEASGVFSNYGPTNTRLERVLIEELFTEGHCVTVCNATIGLMLAIREVIGEGRPKGRRYALMPSFTFAATAHAAMWCGLTPLFCDIDPETWLPCRVSEESLLRQYAGEIAVVVPYATFGNDLDLARYQALSVQHQVPIVVDAAASLGAQDVDGKAFGVGFPWPLVFSMHATKAFSVGEGGLIYCADEARVARLRCMGAFGFEESRSATMLGLNSKLTEVGALTALLQLQRFPAVIQQRARISRAYRHELGAEFPFQRRFGQRQVSSFESILLPREASSSRARIIGDLAEKRIGAGTYFSPHLAQQPYFRQNGVTSELAVTDDIANRILSLPLLPTMSLEEVAEVADAVRWALRRSLPVRRGSHATPQLNRPVDTRPVPAAITGCDEQSELHQQSAL